MNELLLLGRDAGCTNELANIFQNAGYAVVEAKDIHSCCRQLRAELQEPGGAIRLRGVTIFNADAIHSGQMTASHREKLRECILSLARQLTPGWRLNLCHKYLEAPCNTRIELTSLEFIFIKIFTMAEMGEPVSRKQIVQTFGEDYLSYDQNRIDTLVRRLRQKVEARVGTKLPLNTERVRGFSFGAVLVIDL